MTEEEMAGGVRTLEYERFCTYPIADVLGAEIQDEYLYLVQPYKISVYQHYGQVRKPQLIEELIYNKLILNYAINHEYICIQTSTFIQIRDRHNWNKLVHTYPILQTNKGLTLILQGHSLYLAIDDATELQFEKIDILNKESINVINLGQISSEANLPSFSKQPIFLNSMGALQDFYIWGKDSKTIQLGMLYTDSGNLKKKFFINPVELKQHRIHNLYHHKVNCCTNSPRFSQYLIIVAQQINTKQLCLILYQILPTSISNTQSHSQSQSHQDKMQERINQQFMFLRNINNDCIQSNDLIGQVVGEAFDSSLGQAHRYEIPLKQMRNYEGSSYHHNQLWVYSSGRICSVELMTESLIGELIKEGTLKIDSIIQSINYQAKTADKIGKGVYQDCILLCEQTTSFLIASAKEASQSIAEQIIEEQEAEENMSIEKQSYEQITQLCKEIVQVALNQRLKQVPIKMGTRHSSKKDEPPLTKIIDRKSIESRVYSETHHLKSKVNEYAVQTEKIDDFEELEMLVAKYSSSFSVSCSKIKQNQFQKDKFDKQITAIVDSMAKGMIEPYLDQKFVGILEQKTQEISSSIGKILHGQLQALNQTMRKMEIKQNNMRGKRIYQYSKQVQNIKNSVLGVVDSLKDREVNKIASQQLILEEARQIKTQVSEIEKGIVAITNKHQTEEQEIHLQISEIMNLMTKLSNKPNAYVEESQAEIDHSDESSSQEEKEERNGGGTQSQKQSLFQESDQGFEGYHQSQFPYRVKEKSRKGASQPYPYQGYYPQFVPPPPPPNPYYYPYGPPPTMPFQPYYSSARMPPHPMMMPENSYERPPKPMKREKKLSRRAKK